MPFYSQIAHHILAHHAAELPDLRGLTVLLPNRYAAQPLARALSVAAGVPLLLPTMTTLADALLKIPLPQAIQSDMQRVAQLYQVLRDQGWFGDADLWGVASELLALIDELTRYAVVLPQSEAEFAEQLTAAYQAKRGEAMQFEAKVVHELWFAMNHDTSWHTVKAELNWLKLWAAQLDTPLYVLRTSDATIAEKRFLDLCRENIDVTVFDLRDMARVHQEYAWLNSSLQSNAVDDLQTLARRLPVGDRLPNLRLFPAQGLEQEAEAADVQIRRWLLEGKTNIAVVVQDRLVARRVRALLERAQVRVLDESGWTFSTLAVSTPLKGWLDVLQNDFYYQDVLDLLKSPFLFADAPPSDRKHAAFLFEQLVRKHGVVAHIASFIKLAQRESPELEPALQRLKAAATQGRNQKLPLVDWLRGLHDSAFALGLGAGWARDAAGQQLLQLLKQWADDLKDNGTRLSFGEWRRWLSQQLDANTFRDMTIESPVRFTHLAATRWRQFDAVLLVGCDATHLPAPLNVGQWFNDGVRATLGLPVSAVQQHQVRDDLFGLLAMNDTVLATWQSTQNGDINLLSPYLEMLRTLNVLAGGSDLIDPQLATWLSHARVRTADATLPEPLTANPSIPADRLPPRISPSGYNSLVACPYQFYARYVLHLNDLEEVRETLDKRDYGTWVHKILQLFHAEIPLLLNASADIAEATLQRISREVFAQALAEDYLAHAWLLRWEKLIPTYLNWQREQETAGWRYAAAEQGMEFTVDEQLVLRGRIDRFDTDADGAICVLDYKTQSATSLKAKLALAGEDVQLACYALAKDASHAAFVSLDGEKVSSIAPDEAIPDLAALNLARLQTVFAQMRSGTPLPAHGRVCDYCEMKGLCRRGAS
ncbi:MAG: PD-(D/E)XK nuclease family protein [Gallionella sp.]|nr:PD-(D/E)XK nuclease family protein [Gallionella sp.]MDD4958149.1 PD-(D/E)XK nuclease family protein [Gallionella sp.]